MKIFRSTSGSPTLEVTRFWRSWKSSPYHYYETDVGDARVGLEDVSEDEAVNARIGGDADIHEQAGRVKVADIVIDVDADEGVVGICRRMLARMYSSLTEMGPMCLMSTRAIFWEVCPKESSVVARSRKIAAPVLKNRFLIA